MDNHCFRSGHAGARTQDLGVISTSLYRLSYATDNQKVPMETEGPVGLTLTNIRKPKCIKQKEILDNGRIRTCAGDPNRFLVYRLNRSATLSVRDIHRANWAADNSHLAYYEHSAVADGQK